MNSAKATFAASTLLAMIAVNTRADERGISVAGTWRLDVPEICAESDDVLPPATDRNAPRVLQGIARHNMERVRTTCSEFFSMFEL